MTLVYVNNTLRVQPESEEQPAGGQSRPADVARQGGVVLPGPQERLRRRQLEPGEEQAVWWVGAHGGAGESTLEDLFSGSRAAGHCWPMSAAGLAPAEVVLVARTHARGLEAAQRAMRQWAFPGFVQVSLLGLVLIADAPGRLPRPLRDLADHVKGGAPRVWWVPWVEAWRLGEPPGPHNAPTSVTGLLEDLRDLVTDGSPTGTGEEQ